MYAIVETGGKQYRVEQGTRLKVESLPHAAGDEIALDRVLLLQADGGLKVGNPIIAGATVSAKVIANDRAKKVIVFKKRSKKTYKKWIGHRQNYTELLITNILGGGAPPNTAEAVTSAAGTSQTPKTKKPAKSSEPKAQSPERS